MMDETSFKGDVKCRIGAQDVDVFQGNEDIYAPLPGKRCGVVNWHEVNQHDSDSSTDDVADVGTANREQNKPLLYPRHHHVHSRIVGNGCLCRALRQVASCVLAIVLMASFACFVIYFVRLFDVKMKTTTHEKMKLVGCSKIVVEDVWVVGFPKLMTESAFRLLDVTGDGILDVIFGFATGAEGYNVPDVVCDIYFAGVHPCLGGLLALDGLTGREVWRHYSPHEVFAINCNQDLDGDSMKDCIIAGRVGMFEAVSGRDGHLLWNFTDQSVRVEVMNLYTGQFVSDLNGDGVPDIVNIHGGDPFGQPGSVNRLPGKIILFSGRDGKVLRQVMVPDGRESYYSPVLYKKRDGVEVMLFGTGGETHPGALWVITLSDLYKGRIDRAEKIYSNPVKGIMTPPVLLDLTADGVLDIIFANYNSTVLAFCGEMYKQLWNFTYPMSETYATPSPGFYTSDDVPDFMIHWQYGPGFPVYYHSVTTILDGSDGRALVFPFIRSSVGAQTSPLTVSVEGFGNDIFLYWNADCKGHEGEGREFSFVKGTNVHEQSRSDFCRLRFKSEGVNRMYAMSSHTRPPGIIVYNSEARKDVEHRWAVNTTAEALQFLQRHPENMEDFLAWRHELQHHTHGKTKMLDSDGDRRSIFPLGSSNSDGDLNEEALAYDGGGRSTYGHGNDLDIGDYEADGAFDRSNIPESEYTNLLPYHSPQYDGLQDNRKRKILWPRGQSKSRDDGSQTGMDGDQRVDGFPRSRKKKRLHRTRDKRIKRHVGPHDEGGLQRLISTGTLAPPLLDPSHPDYNQSIDILFATYWFYPAKTETLLAQDRKCIEERLATQSERYDPSSKYYGMDDDGFESVVTEECLKRSDHRLPDNGTYQSQTMYTPYAVNMGQLTVYRLRLKCHCPKVESGQRCSRILPFEGQQWSAYMGPHADGHSLPRKPSEL